MKGFKRNSDIIVRFVNRQLTNVSEFDNAITISESEDITVPKLLNYSNELQYTLVTIWWSFLLIGSYFRYIFYKYLYQQYKNKSKKTIDRLLWVIAVLHHLFIIFATVEVTLKVLNYQLLNNSALGYAACRFKNYYYKFFETNACIGSLGLASYRLLYLKKGEFVKDVVGEKTLANIILFLGLGLSALVVLLPRVQDQTWSHLEWEPCFNTPQMHHALEYIDDYIQSAGLPTALTGWKQSYLGVRVVYMLATATEICMYISFFHFMYIHDNCKNLARLLEPAVIRQRNKQNATSFFGQFCSFVMEFIGDILFIVAIVKSAPSGENEQDDFYIYAFINKPVTFAAIAFIEVMTSNVLRARLFKFE